MSKKANGRGMGHNSGVLRLYRSYNHVDKDPAIDAIRTAMQDEGMDKRRLSLLSNVGEGTIENWLEGKTKRPQHITLAAAAGAMGYEFSLKRTERKNYDKELVSAANWHKRHETAHAHNRSKK